MQATDPRAVGKVKNRRKSTSRDIYGHAQEIDSTSHAAKSL